MMSTLRVRTHSAWIARFVGCCTAFTLIACVPRMAVAQSGGPDSSPEPASSGAVPAGGAGEQAQSADAGTLEFFRSTELGGFVDTYYTFYSSKLDAPYRSFDFEHNQFTPAMAQIWLNKAPSQDSRVGFKTKLNLGSTTPVISFAEPDNPLQYVQEAYVSYLAPAGNGLQIDVGKWVTQHGAEVIEAMDNWNYSRSILFGWAIPFYHSGVRASYDFNEKVRVGASVSNGWNNVYENNTGKTVGVGLTLTPTESVTIMQNYMFGPEQIDNNDDIRHLYDATVSYAATPALSLMVNYDYGRDELGALDVEWQGIAGYLKYQGNQWAVSPRFEWYDDPDGFSTGTIQTMKETTITLELMPTDTFRWRIEYRSDFSDRPVFETDAGELKKSQHSIGFGWIFAFGTT